MTTARDMLISRRVMEMAESATMAMTRRAAEMRAAGTDVVILSAGEPDFDTPEHIKQAAVEAMKAGKTKYTANAGIPELREAIAEKFRRDQGIGYDPAQILVSCGGKHSIFNILHALLDPGDEVLIPAPYWTSYPEMVKSAGGRPVILRTREANDFLLAADQLENAINSKTKILLYSSPCNPTGGVYTEEKLRKLAEILEETDILVISDEIYEKLLYGGARHVSIAQVSPEMAERTLVVNGVSKAYAMTGWRIGYAAGPKEIIAAAAKIQSQATGNANTIAQHAAAAALTGDQECVETMRRAYDERRAMIVERLSKMPGVTCREPRGTFYVFPNVKAHYGKSHAGRRIGNSVEMCAALLEQARVAAVPGDAFGGPDNIRFSYAASTEQITEGLNRADRFFRELV